MVRVQTTYVHAIKAFSDTPHPGFALPDRARLRRSPAVSRLTGSGDAAHARRALARPAGGL